MNELQIVKELEHHVEELRKQLSGYDNLKQGLRKAESALRAFSGSPRNESGEKTNRIYLTLQTKPEGIGSAQLADELGMVHSTINYHLSKLLRRGMIRKTGISSGTLWHSVTRENKDKEKTKKRG